MRNLALVSALVLGLASRVGAAALPDWTPYFVAAYSMEENATTRANNTGALCGSACDIGCVGGTQSGTHVEGSFAVGLSSQSCSTSGALFPTTQSTFDGPATWGCWARPTADAFMDLVDGSVGSAHGYYAQREHGRCSTTTTTNCTVNGECPGETCVSNPRWACEFGSGVPFFLPPAPLLLPGTSNAPINTFSHVVCRIDNATAANNATISVNAVQEAVGTAYLSADRKNSNGWFLGGFQGSINTWQGQLDECFVYNGTLNDAAICRICSCGIDGARCARSGAAYTPDPPDRTARCNSCTLPPADLAAPDGGLGTTSTSTSTTSSTSTSATVSTTSTSVPAAPPPDWTPLMQAVWHMEGATNGAQVNDAATICGSSCDLSQGAGNTAGTTQDTGSIAFGTASASFGGQDGFCTGGTYDHGSCATCNCTTANTNVHTGCPGGTCSAVTTYLEKTSPPANLNIATDLAAGCWVRPGGGFEPGGAGNEANNRLYAIYHYDRSTNHGYQLGIHGSGEVFAKVDASEVLEPEVRVPSFLSFRHIAFAWRNGPKSLTTYVNGAKHFSAAPLTLSTVTAPFRIGRGMDVDLQADPSFDDPSHEFFSSWNGNIDECFVYAGVMSDPGECRICSCGIEGSGAPGFPSGFPCMCGTDGVSYTSVGQNVGLCSRCALPVCNAANPSVTALAVVASTTTTTSVTSTTSSSVTTSTAATTTSTSSSSTSSSVTSTSVVTTSSTSATSSSTSSTSTSTSSSTSVTSTTSTSVTTTSVTTTTFVFHAGPGTTQVTCGAGTVLIDLTRVARKHLILVNTSAQPVTICYAPTCTVGAGLILRKDIRLHDRHYRGPLSCVTNTSTALVSVVTD